MTNSLLLHNACVYTVDETFSIQEAVAIQSGQIVAVGTSLDLLAQYSELPRIDLQGKAVFPGFIDAHCHFKRYALSLSELDLINCNSFSEVIGEVKGYVAAHHPKVVIGRNWDQNRWEGKTFPNKTELDRLFPDLPIFLSRTDIHAALVNQKALDMAGIDSSTIVEGGAIELKDGEPTGILLDNAIAMVENVLPRVANEKLVQAIQQAEENCFAVGLTTLVDALMDWDYVQLISEMQEREQLKVRIYGVLEPSKRNQEHFFKKGIYKTESFQVRAFKYFADGAIGSRGALLKEDYADDAGNKGIQIHSEEYFLAQAKMCLEHGFQMVTHAIGDRANELMLDIYAKVLQGSNPHRWRIEHAQIVRDTDLPKFGQHSIIPSIQATHATSDMDWVGDRLGNRLKDAYRYGQLLESAGMVAAGSDFPIESINPIYGFYAAVARRDHEYQPAGGFQMENALSREDALKAMTVWAAYANFEEKEKGSIEVGKYADLVILDQDIMKVSLSSIPQTKVLYTILGGEIVFSAT